MSQTHMHVLKTRIPESSSTTSVIKQKSNQAPKQLNHPMKNVVKSELAKAIACKLGSSFINIENVMPVSSPKC